MHTQSRFVRRLAFALTAVAALAAQSSAQHVRETTLYENPTRDVGGSCIYGGDGKLLHAPRGAMCPEMEQAPASGAPASEPGRAAAPNDAVRAEAAALLAERERLDVELARVREALAYEDREAARRVVDESLRKIARHLEREARLLQPLSALPASPQP
jgi:hypothetical protein